MSIFYLQHIFIYNEHQENIILKQSVANIHCKHFSITYNKSTKVIFFFIKALPILKAFENNKNKVLPLLISQAFIYNEYEENCKQNLSVANIFTQKYLRIINVKKRHFFFNKTPLKKVLKLV